MNAFSKIIGYDTIKNELYQIIDMFKNKELYDKIGAKPVKGILIYGAPGLGKTMLAEALIEECNVKSFTLRKNKNENDFINEMNDAFMKASLENQALILCEDIDRWSESSEYEVDDKFFITLQSLIDSVKNNNVLVVATANNYRKLPDSLVRSQRFDRKIGLKPPTYEDACKIIEYYLKTKSVNPNLNYEDVSKMISYSSCSMLQTLLNEAAVYCAYERKEMIDIDDIVKAYLRSMNNFPDETYNCSKEQIEATIYHEIGHAVCASIIKEGSVGLVTVQTNGRNNMEGYTRLCEEITRRPENIVIALGGKAAVELFYQGRCGSGCQSDLSKAANMLRDGVTSNATFGMGLLDVSGNDAAYSDAFSTSTEAIVHGELERYMFITKDILIKNKDYFMRLVDELRQKHYLLYSDIKRVRDSVNIQEVAIQ